MTDQLEQLGEALPDFGVRLSDVSQFGVLVRYDAGVPLTGMERNRYRKLVADLRMFVIARVSALP